MTIPGIASLMHQANGACAQIRRQICVCHSIVHRTRDYSVKYAEIGCTFQCHGNDDSI